MTKLFLEFELNEELFELRCGGQSVATQGRVFDLIAYLVRHRDRVVSKDELTRELWGASVTSDTAISQVVKLARKALRDEGKSQRVLKTVRGRGFRFIADVRENDTPTVAAKQPSAPVRELAKPRTNRPAEALIGREAETERLLRALSNLQQDRGGLILIEGEPGIGKTTLAEALATAAAEHDIDVFWGRAWEDGGASPFWPWIQVLRGMLQRDGSAATQRFMGQGQAELGQLLPELRNPQTPPNHDHGQHARFRLFDAMARFLRNACQRSDDAGAPARPRLIVLEDLHAIDEASIQFLRFLAPELDDSALLVVGTFRDLELADHPALAHLADGLVEAQRIRLEGFARSEVSALLERRLPEPPSSVVVDTLLEMSAGNPLLLFEICRRLDPAHPESWPEAAALSARTLPERIIGAVRRQLTGLPPATSEILSSASALGREFPLPLLAAMTGCTEPELMDQLAPAAARGLVRPSASSPDRMLFAHAQARNAIYADLTPNRRLELHRRIAEQLETRPSERLPLSEIAHHYFLAAAAPGCRRKALDYAERAAKRASDMRAYEVAAGLYDRALQLSESQGAGPEALHELLRLAGDAWYQAGQLENATARYDRSASLAREGEQWERFATAVSASVMAMRGSFLHDRARQQQVREALSHLPKADSSLRANLLAASAIGVRAETTLAQRDATTGEAVEMSRRLRDEATLLHTLMARHFDLWGVAHPRDMLVIATEMVELARKLNNHERLLDALLCRIQDHSELGEHEALFRDVEEYIAEAEHFGSPWHRYMLLLFQTTDAATSGDFDRAADLSEGALRLGLRVRDPLAQAFHVMRMLFITLARGSDAAPEEARALLDEPPSCVPEDYHPFWALAAALRGDRANASNLVARLLTQNRRHLVLAPLRAPLLATAGRVCAILGDSPNTEHVYQLLLPNNGLHLQLQAGVHLGTVSFYLGTMAAQLGRHDDAIAHFEQALVECENVRIWLARTQYALGAQLGPPGGARARELLRSAEATAAQLGMCDLGKAAQDALARFQD